VTPKKGPDSEASEGWESLVEESEGVLAPSEELEQAMREAAEAIEAQRADAAPSVPQPKAPEGELGPKDELSELQDRYMRLAADFDNFRRRALREREEAHGR
jgi:molecular chaperone GrpE (heat shock protein)